MKNGGMNRECGWREGTERQTVTQRSGTSQLLHVYIHIYVTTYYH